ncbi:Proteasome subunit alpha type-2 [Sarcoptes scabiei]|nr:Proteasome subunit alpha type-2 [Sarcoptes scabiei]
MNDLVAVWEVPLCDRTHRIEFEHGTTTGRRVIYLDGKILLKKDWMFKLVGSEYFEIPSPDGEEILAKCEIQINACMGFTYEYVLYVNGKQFKTFKEKQTKIMRSWHFVLGEQKFRVVLEKDTLDVWVNGQRKNTINEFCDSEGTEIKFDLDDENQGLIRTISSKNKRTGMVYKLEVNNNTIEDREEFDCE